MSDKTAEAVELQKTPPKVDKPWLFQPGQSGNPAGKKPGTLSLKGRVEKYLLDNPKKLDKLIMTLATNPKFHALMWQMLEGMPSQKISGDPDKPITIQLSSEVAQRNNIIQGELVEPNNTRTLDLGSATNNKVYDSTVGGEGKTVAIDKPNKVVPR